MKRFCTYTTETDETIKAVEAPALVPEDWSEYVFQYAENAAAAIAQHDRKIDEYQADNEAGRPIKDTY